MLQTCMLQYSKTANREGFTMAWNRHRSKLEVLAVDVLIEANEPLTLKELAKRIHERKPDILEGKTPEKSLYSVIYRREKRRKARGHKQLFKQVREGDRSKYYVSRELPDSLGEKIK